MEKFKKKAIVQKTIGAELSNLGFEYVPKSVRPTAGDWSYLRERPNCTQEVCIEIIWDKELRVWFGSDIPSSPRIFSDSFMEGHPLSLDCGQFYFTSKSEFETICHEFAKVIHDRGEELAFKASQPAHKAYLEYEFDLYIYDHREELAQKCMKELGLKDLNNIDDVIERLQAKMLAIYQEPWESVRETIAQMSALWGQAFLNYANATVKDDTWICECILNGRRWSFRIHNQCNLGLKCPTMTMLNFWIHPSSTYTLKDHLHDHIQDISSCPKQLPTPRFSKKSTKE